MKPLRKLLEFLLPSSPLVLPHSFDPNLNGVSIVTGCMGSGKSNIAIAEANKFLNYSGALIFIVKPPQDVKTNGNDIGSRSGLKATSHPIATAQEILPQATKYFRERDPFNSQPRMLFVEEAPFYGLELIKELDNLHKIAQSIYVITLDMDFRGRELPFFQETKKHQLTRYIHMFNACCQMPRGDSICGHPAEYSIRLRADKKGAIKPYHKREQTTKGFLVDPYYTYTFEELTTHDPNKIEDGKVGYFAGCKQCFERYTPLPGQEATLEIKRAIMCAKRRGLTLEELQRAYPRYGNFEKMLTFLTTDIEAMGVIKKGNSFVYDPSNDSYPIERNNISVLGRIAKRIRL